MTSGNLSEEPIAAGNDEARARLGDIADGFLLHDREIVARVDDSVVRLAASGPILLRRARGLRAAAARHCRAEPATAPGRRARTSRTPSRWCRATTA